MITHGNLVIPNDTVIATCREQKPGMFCLQRRAASPQVGIQNRVAGRVQRSFGVAGSHWHLLKVSKITCTIHAGRSRFQSAAWKVVSENGVKIPFQKTNVSMCFDELQSTKMGRLLTFHFTGAFFAFQVSNRLCAR